MADNKLNILLPSVNNLCARIFVRAAGLEFEEKDMWGKKDEPGFVQKDPALLTPMLEEDGLPRGSLWESCAIMQYLCNKHGLDRFYPTDPGERAMIDSAMFYLVGTLYPLVARATYPVLGFPQYPSPEGRRGRARRAPRRLPGVLPRGQEVHRRELPVDRRHAAGGDARVPACDRLRLPGLGDGVHERDGVGPG
jgi:glutathione S-transferase